MAKLNNYLKIIQKNIHENKPLNSVVKSLEKASQGYNINAADPLNEVVIEFQRELNRSGIIPLKFNATYWSQSRLPENRCLELSWQRNDLLIHRNLHLLKVPKSHGPGFRLRIWGDGVMTVGLSNRFSYAGDAAKNNFAKNVISDNGYLDFFFEKIISKYRFSLSWIGEDFEPETFSELVPYIKSNHSKAVNNFIYIDRVIKASATTTPKALANQLAKSFKTLSPFYYAMLFNLQPKKSKSHSSVKGQLTREQLRSQLLKHEHRCQNESCRIPTKLQVIEMAHMVPGIHELSNVLALCSVCHNQQQPRTSKIKLDGLIAKSKNSFTYGVTVQTRMGEQHWRLQSHHKLASF